MDKHIKVKLKERSYDIVVGKGLLEKSGSLFKKLRLGDSAVIVSNKTIFKLHGHKLLKGLKRAGIGVRVILVPDGEKSKSATAVIEVVKKIAADDAGKKTFLVAFGGGVVGDMAGFAASIYKRGIPYVQVPTTFLAQIDSSIGGKTAVDLSVGKNLAGSIYQPRLVLSDTNVLSTIGLRQIRNGLAEAVKYGVIDDKSLFEFIEKNYRKILSGDPKALIPLVQKCSRIKAKIVSADEKETKNLRTILNFGHTLGHAVEAAGSYQKYQHGEAIALGMRMAADIAVQKGLFSFRDGERLNRILSLIGLPREVKGLTLSQIFKMMAHDKKFKGSTNRFVLPVSIGKVRVVENVSRQVIVKAIKRYS